MNVIIKLCLLQIRENHRQTERMIDKFNDYVARTSNYGMLKVSTVLDMHNCVGRKLLLLQVLH